MQKNKNSDVLEINVHYITSVMGVESYEMDFAEDNGFEKLTIFTNKATLGKIAERNILEHTGFTLSLSEFAYVCATFTFTRPLTKDPLA